MKKKFSLLMAAIAIVAFAVPAFASGAAQLTEGGKALTGEPTILGTSTNATTTTSLGVLKCELVTVTGKVTKNTGGVVTGVGIGPGFGTVCTVGGKKATVSDITLTHIHATGPADPNNAISVHFTALLNGEHCQYSATNVPFTYTTNTDSLKIASGNLNGVPAALCEPGILNGDFTLETDVSPLTAIILD